MAPETGREEDERGVTPPTIEQPPRRPQRTRGLLPLVPSAYQGCVSSLAALILAWCGVYSYVCAYYGLLWLRRRSEREYLAFSCLCGGLAIYALSQVLLTDAETGAEVYRATRIGGLGLLLVVPCLVSFISTLSGYETRLERATYIWSAVGLALLAAGRLYDPAAPASVPWVQLTRNPGHAATPTTLVADAYLLSGFILAATATTFLLARPLTPRRPSHPLSQFDHRLVLVTLVVSLGAGAHDALLLSGRLVSINILPHVALVFVAAMTYVLLDRFARASRALFRRTVELRSACEALQRTQEELVRKEQLAAVGELSAVIAHEVRNPLAVIKNAVSGLRRMPVDAVDHQTLLDILDEETNRLNRLVHDLLAYASPVTPRARALDVAELVGRSVTRAASGAEHADLVEVIFDLDGPETVFGDPELLRHALVNVIENAMQSMSRGGTLTIRSRDGEFQGRPGVLLSFEDTGEGMDTIVRSKARDPFFTTRPSGTGLGLAIVERVVRTHAGTVEIESRHGEGTRVTFILPTGRPSALPITPSVETTRDGRLSGIRELP